MSALQVNVCDNERFECKNAMSIRKTKSGHQVVSKKGKPLSKKNLSKKAAVKRLKQVEYFKKKK